MQGLLVVRLVDGGMSEEDAEEEREEVWRDRWDVVGGEIGCGSCS